MDAFLLGFGLIFVAELGDKSQLMALAFATRYRALPVLIAIGLATAGMMAISVAVGFSLSQVLPRQAIGIAGGLVFFAFAVMTLRDNDDEEEEEVADVKSTGSIILAVATAFLLSEIGDKTMLTTIDLAANHQAPIGIWAGSTAGMVTADGLAILLGRFLGTRLPKRAIRYAAAVGFMVFGAILLVGALQGAK